LLWWIDELLEIKEEIMSSYSMSVILRGDATEGQQGTEWEYQCVGVLANSELEARRKILEQSWSRGLLISQFQNVHIQEDQRGKRK